MPALLTAGMVAMAVAGWFAGGWLVALAGLDALDLLGRAAGVVAALALAEVAQARLMRTH